MFVDYYDVLGIKSSATEEQIKKAYRLNAIKYHPDKHSGDPYFTEKFQHIKEAYDNLIDSEKRRIFNNQYYAKYGYIKDILQSYSTSQPKYESVKQEEREAEKKKEEQFRYDPYKQFYSSYDREQQDTPQFKPQFDIWGDTLDARLEFFKLPKQIGKIIAGFSDLVQGVQPLKASEKFRGYFVAVIIGVVVGSIIYFFANLKDPIWIITWFALPSLFTLWSAASSHKFIHTNFYVGVNGFAQFTCENSRENITIDKEINFNEITDFYVLNTQVSKNFVYQHTDYVYVCLNRNKNKVVFKREGQFNKKVELKKQEILLNFYRIIERYWTVYQLDNLENNLQQKGYVDFCLYSHKNNAYQEFIKLGIGFITFLRSDGQEFTYNFNEIKQMYLKGDELRIQHKNFERSFYFFKSGNEDAIPLLNLCNRQFFLKAIEILLGYSIV